MNAEVYLPSGINPDFPEKIAYFCMEFAIHQPLKTYAGGLGFLAGSHMRSAWQLKMNMVGIGILWKHGYYDQIRRPDQGMEVQFQEKIYGFLKKTGIRLSITVSGHDIQVAVYYLPPEIFHTAPVFFLSTDLPENDYLSRCICHRLYDPNPETKIAAAILLGDGGAKLLEQLNWLPDVYHLNESHALPLAFHLYKKYGAIEEVRKRLVFTNHTPEPGGNEKSNMPLLEKMGFFLGVSREAVDEIVHPVDNVFDHTLAALKCSRIANAVSQLHLKSLHKMWDRFEGICPMTGITNAQDYTYWHDQPLYAALNTNDDDGLRSRKRFLKQQLFEEVADQCGEIYDAGVLTIVFARRFGGYKRPELLLNNMDRFQKIVTNKARPVQLIWAGKPYPMDYSAIASFDRIVNVCKTYPNCAVLVGYELSLSKLLKQGADVWLNVPRLTHEASGTSGMSAAMNGALNVSIPDGWFPEFAIDGVNSFIIPAADPALPDYEQDETDANALYDLLEQKVIPMYYKDHSSWSGLVKRAMRDIVPQYNSTRMVKEYYQKMYKSPS